MNLQISLAQKMLYTDGTTIKDHIGEELYDKMVAKLKEKGSYNSMYDNYKPAFFESLFENAIIVDANMDANAGIDMHFLKLAKSEQKDILEIETAESQCYLRGMLKVMMKVFLKCKICIVPGKQAMQMN